MLNCKEGTQKTVTDGDIRYDFKSVKTVRGMTTRTIAKWEAQGWELTGQAPGVVRTELTFRRAKAKVSKKAALALAGVFATLVLTITIGAVTEGDGTPSSGAPQTATVASASQAPIPGSTTTEPASAPTQTVAEQEAKDRAEQTKIARAEVKAKAEAKKKAAQKAKKRAEQKAKEKKAAAKAKAAARREAAQNRADAKLTFGNCPTLNRRYPHGVGQTGARDQTSGSRVTSFKVSDHIYALNSGSDRDGDGIACEKR